MCTFMCQIPVRIIYILVQILGYTRAAVSIQNYNFFWFSFKYLYNLVGFLGGRGLQHKECFFVYIRWPGSIPKICCSVKKYKASTHGLNYTYTYLSFHTMHKPPYIIKYKSCIHQSCTDTRSENNLLINIIYRN